MADDETLKTTVLDGKHRALGARMVPFGGYAMPVQYPTGIIAEHKWTREHAGLFDVSHMGPSFVMLNERSGDPDVDHRAVAGLVEPLVSGDIAGLKPGQIRYTLLLNETGGTVDDLMIGRSPTFPGGLYVVVNAGTKDNDFALIAKAIGNRAALQRGDSDYGLLALQGPKAVEVLSAILPGVEDLGFMTYGAFDYEDDKVFVSRSGYTGEDGFEILIANRLAGAFWDTLVADARVKPIGLGARDSLRLEAGLPLYGHELDETISPVEAGLKFAVSKRRREAGDLAGSDRILREFTGQPTRLRVGLLVEGAPAREGADILDASGGAVGKVTSGGFAPSLNRPIAMGYVPPALAAPGTKLQVSVRGRAQPAEVTAMPFVPHNYVRTPK
jgi:aminomethyltransferase